MVGDGSSMYEREENCSEPNVRDLDGVQSKTDQSKAGISLMLTQRVLHADQVERHSDE